MDYTVRFPAGIRTFNYISDMTFTGLVGRIFYVSAARDHRRVRRPQNPPQHPDVCRRDHHRLVGRAPGHRPVRDGRRHHGRRQHVRLHRRQGGARDRPDEQVRRVLGLGHRPLLGHPAVHRAHLPLFEPGPDRLRDGGVVRDDVRADDELHAGARRIAHRQVQGRLHGAPGADGALHDRRVHATGWPASCG